MVCSYAPGEPARRRGNRRSLRRSVEIHPNPMGRQAAFFTEVGLAGLRQLLRNSRAMDHERFGYLRRQLGMMVRLLTKAEVVGRGVWPRPVVALAPSSE